MALESTKMESISKSVCGLESSLRLSVAGARPQRSVDEDQHWSVVGHLENIAEMINRTKVTADEGYNCTKCGNRGWFINVRDGYEYIRDCECMTIRASLRNMEQSGLVYLEEKYTFDNYVVNTVWRQEFKRRALDFLAVCQVDSPWFFAGGQTGAGKSHICTALAVSLLKSGKRTRYVIWSQVAPRLKGAAPDFNLKTELEECDVLYIDDLFKTGAAYGSDRMTPSNTDIRIAFDLLSHRVNLAKKITILSSELTITQLLELDEATAGRIVERTNGQRFMYNIGKNTSRNWRIYPEHIDGREKNDI